MVTLLRQVALSEYFQHVAITYNPTDVESLSFRQRLGQYYYNALGASGRLDLARQIVGTEVDPFYDDELLGAFFVWLTNNWSHENSDPETQDA